MRPPPPPASSSSPGGRSRAAAAAAAATPCDEAAVHRFLCVAAAAAGMRRRLQLSVCCCAYAPMASVGGSPPAAASALTAAASSVLSLAAVGASCARVSAAGRLLGALAVGSARLPSEGLLRKFSWYMPRPVVLHRQQISWTSSSFCHSWTARRSVARRKSPGVTASSETQLLSSCRLACKCAELRAAGTNSCVTNSHAAPAAAGAAAAPAAAFVSGGVTRTKAGPSPSSLLRFPLAEWLLRRKARPLDQPNPRPASRRFPSAAAVARAGLPDVVGTRVAAGGSFFAAAAAAGKRCAAPRAGTFLFAGSTAPAALAAGRRAAGAALGPPAAALSSAAAGLSSAAAAPSSAAADCGSAARSAWGHSAATVAAAAPLTPAVALGTAAPAAPCGAAAAAAVPVGNRRRWADAWRAAAEGRGRGTSCGDAWLHSRRRSLASAAAAAAPPPPPSAAAAAEAQVQQQDLGPLLHAVNLPPLGDSVTRGSVLEWRKKVGDPVGFDEVLCVIETDKVTVEIHSDCEGVVVAHAAAEGESLSVGSQLALIRVADSEAADTSSLLPAAESPQAARLQQDAQQAEPQQQLQQRDGTRGDVQRAAAGEQEQQQQQEQQHCVGGKQRAASGEAAGHSGNDREGQAAPEAAGGNAEGRTAAAGGEERGKHSRTRSPSICFRFGRRKASAFGGGETAGSTAAPASPGRDAGAQQQTGDLSPASADAAAQEEDPVMQLWGVPRWRTLSEEEIEAVNLGGAGAEANALGSWKVAVVHVKKEKKEPQKKRQEAKPKQQDAGGKQQKASSKQ